MLGYQDDWGKTIDPASGDWYRTGDVARRDAEQGYFYYVGRADDLFKSSEYRISPFELESVLIEHEAVAEAAVVPSSDASGLSRARRRSIELATALSPGRRWRRRSCVSPGPPRSLQAHSPRRVRVLPKTMTGKIRRVELRQREEDLRKSGERGEHEYWEEDFPEHEVHA